MNNTTYLYVFDDHQCSDCGKQLLSYLELQKHIHRVHGYKNCIRGYMPTCTCMCCLRQFGSKFRLLCHVQRKSNQCAASLFQHFRSLDKEISDVLDRQNLATVHCGPCRQQTRIFLVDFVLRDRYLAVDELFDVIQASIST